MKAYSWIHALTLCTAMTASAVDIESAALRLTWGPDGRLTRVHCAGADVTRGVEQAGGFALRDCRTQADYEPITCTVEPEGGALRLNGRNAAGTLELDATLRAERGWIAIRGEIRNLTDDHHAVSLRFGLPLQCEGWRWARNLYRHDRLLKERRRHLGVRTGIGSGHMALRPVAAVADDAHTLGLVVPIDRIGTYDFFADAGAGVFALVLDVAMTPLCARFHKRVPFEFYATAEPDGWGLRSVLQRYYRNRPDFFERHLPEAGGWFAWGDILRQPPPATDYGLMFHEQPESGEGYEHDEALGIRVFPYIEAGMYQMCMGDQDERPSQEFALARVAQWALPETTGRLPSGGFSTQEALQRICAAVVASGPQDRDGQVIISRISQYNWISGSRWAAQFPLNLSPSIPDGAGAMRLEQALASARRPEVDGVYLDSYSAHLRTVNYAAAQLEYLEYPPVFDAKTFEPCDLVGFAKAAWVEALWRSLPETQRTLLPNLYGQPIPFPWHRFSVFGKEHWVAPTGGLMQQYRMMAYRKVVTQLPAYEDQTERFLRNLLLLDVFPGGYARRSTDPPQGMRESYRQLIPLFRLLDRLGWEPVTQAQPQTPGLQVERYGAAPGPLVLALHNPYAASVTRLTVDTAALGLTANVYPVAWFDDAPVEYVRDGSKLRVGVGLSADSTNLLIIGDPPAQGTWLRMLAADRLDDARRRLTEYAVRRDPAHPHPATKALQSLSVTSTVTELERATHLVTGSAPTETRARELLNEAVALLQRAPAPAIPPSQAPEATPGGEEPVLPWRETFDELSAELWQFDEKEQGIRLAGGRLEMELPRDKRNISAVTRQTLPLAPKPLVFECDLKFSHGSHDKYLMMGLRFSSSPGGGDEYLLVRIEGEGPGVIRVENHEAPATGWQVTLTDWSEFDLAQAHHLKLRLDTQRFVLYLDGKQVGSGLHDCGFGAAFVNLELYSGHRGHGDVCWWDNLHAYAAED